MTTETAERERQQQIIDGEVEDRETPDHDATDDRLDRLDHYFAAKVDYINELDDAIARAKRTYHLTFGGGETQYRALSYLTGLRDARDLFFRHFEAW